MTARVMVEVFDDRVEISDPGGLPSSLKPEEFGTRSVLRNPVISDLLLRVGYIERMGTGIRRIEDLCRENGTLPPGYDFTGFFTTTYIRESYSTPKAQSEAQSLTILKALQGAQLSADELVNALGLKSKTGSLKRTIKALLEEELVEYTIPDKPNSRLQRYRVTEKGKETVRGE